MEENNDVIKRGRGRPRILTDEERNKNKTKCMLGKEWYCDICNTGINYTCIRSSGLPVASRGIVGTPAQKSGHRLAASPYWITSSGLASVTFRAKKPSF